MSPFVTIQSETQKVLIDVKRIVLCRFDRENNTAFFKLNSGHFELVKDVIDLANVIDEVQSKLNPQPAAVTA